MLTPEALNTPLFPSSLSPLTLAAVKGNPSTELSHERRLVGVIKASKTPTPWCAAGWLVLLDARQSLATSNGYVQCCTNPPRVIYCQIPSRDAVLNLQDASKAVLQILCIYINPTILSNGRMAASAVRGLSLSTYKRTRMQLCMYLPAPTSQPLEPRKSYPNALYSYLSWYIKACPVLVMIHTPLQPRVKASRLPLRSVCWPALALESRLSAVQ